MINILSFLTGGAAVASWGIFRISKVNTEIIDVYEYEDGHLKILIKNNSHISQITIRARLGISKPGTDWKYDKDIKQNSILDIFRSDFEKGLRKLPYLYASRPVTKKLYYRKQLDPKDHAVFSTKSLETHGDYPDFNTNLFKDNNVIWIFIEQTGEVHRLNLNCYNTCTIRYTSEIDKWKYDKNHTIQSPHKFKKFANLTDWVIFPLRRFYKFLSTILISDQF